jgi:hypothetical protein
MVQRRADLVVLDHGNSPFLALLGWSVVLRFADFGVILVRCGPLFPERGVADRKTLSWFRESLVFCRESFLSFR